MPVQTNEVETRYSKKKFKFFESNGNKTHIMFCRNCKQLFESGNKVTYKIVWPSFMWSFLSDRTLQENYGNRLLSILPSKWRYWWAHNFCDITLKKPDDVVRDVTEVVMEFLTLIDSRKLSDLSHALDKNLLPVVSCPWGCTEYIHLAEYFSNRHGLATIF